MTSITAERFNTYSLQLSPHGESVKSILAAALAAVDPGVAVRRSMHLVGQSLTIGNKEYNLAEMGRIWLVAAGKAALPMTIAAADTLSKHLHQGISVSKDPPDSSMVGMLPGNIQTLQAGHPLPDGRSVQAAQAISQLLQKTERGDLVLVLISGGASALLASPAHGLSLDDLQRLTRVLLGCGASIQEINVLRKHLEHLKGGQMARLASPARVASLVLSDVLGDPLDLIASGPCVPDPSTFAQALEVLHHYHIQETVPPAVMDILQRGLHGEIPETPKPGDPVFEQVDTFITGSNALAAQAALAEARRQGFNGLLLTGELQGEAREAGSMLGAALRRVCEHGEPISRPACLVAGGETTVTLRGGGLGGRNQELVLSTVDEIAGLPGVMLLSLGTDGSDGPTDAAGAVATGETRRRAQAQEMHPADFLAHNDSYHFFDPLGDLIRSGPTHTNVNDLVLAFAF